MPEAIIVFNILDLISEGVGIGLDTPTVKLTAHAAVGKHNYPNQVNFDVPPATKLSVKAY